MAQERYNGRRMDGGEDDGKPKLTPQFAFAQLRLAAITTGLAVAFVLWAVFGSG